MEQISTVIATYQYTYGVGAEANRKIEFSRSDQENPETLFAKISGKKGEEWIVTSTVSADKISVEQFSTSEKAAKIMAARQKGEMPVFERRLTHSYSTQDQDNILKNLAPNGPRKIEIINEPGGPEGLERVVQLTIFDPS